MRKNSNIDSTHVIAIDLGGTKIAAALVDPNGNFTVNTRRETPAQIGGKAVAEAVADAVNELKQLAESKNLKVGAVGIGTAGVVDKNGRNIIASTDAIKKWAGTPLAQLVEEACGLAVTIENDVCAHLRGESWQGAGRGYKNLLMIALGTGVGGAFMLDGKIMTGPHGIAGDFGHLPIDTPTSLICTCGRKSPHLETIASGPGIVRYFHEKGGDLNVDSARELEKLANEGVQLPARVYKEVGRVTGTCLGGLANVIDTEVVIVGGGLARSGPIWWEPLRKAFQAQLVDVLRDLPLKPAALGNEAALVGAGKLAWDYLRTDKCTKTENNRNNL